MPKIYKNLIGLKFSKLTVLGLYSCERDGVDRFKRYWLCQCDCGNTKVVSGHSLKGGTTKSCGCLNNDYHKKRIIHGITKHPLYLVWYNIIDRCTNPESKDYHNYGGRGITVCEEWKDVTNFYNWAISHGWRKGLKTDRKENNGNYEPSNCHFVTPWLNSLNRRDTVYVNYKGKRITAAELAKNSNISVQTFKSRLKKGWDIEKALTERPRKWESRL